MDTERLMLVLAMGLLAGWFAHFTMECIWWHQQTNAAALGAIAVIFLFIGVVSTFKP